MPGFELMGNDELNAIKRIFEKNNGVLFAHGFHALRNGNYEVRNLEKKAAVFFNIKYCLAVSSGTAGLKIALQCANLKKNDEVITQGFNFISDGEVILDCNAKPIITNVNKTLNMDLEHLKSKINKNTKAVIVCEMLGNGLNIEELENICKENNLLLIDDACEMIGGKYKDKYFGTYGDIGVISLDFGKNITSGEGGLIFTDNEKYYKIMKQYSDHGHVLNSNYPRGEDDYGLPGFNFRMTEIQGAIAMVQIDKLNDIIKGHKERYMSLKSNLDKNEYFEYRQINKFVELSYDTLIIFVDDFILRKLISNFLNNIDIGTKNLPGALRWHCFYYWDHIINKHEKESIKYTKEILNKSIAIPIWLKKSPDDYKILAKSINDIIQNYKLNNYKLELDYLAIIPARSGSKGLINKNGKKMINNKSLIEIVTQKVDDSRLVDATFFSSNSKKYKDLYLKEALTKNLTSDYIRPEEISTDTSTRNEYILDCLEYFKKRYPNVTINNIIITQVTCPNYTYKDLDECIIKYKNSEQENLVSVCESWNHSSELITFEKNTFKLINNKLNKNRQTYKKNYFINGCFYISKTDTIYKNLKKNINYEPFEIDNKTDIFIMNKESGIDIDEEFDVNLLHFFNT